jgi:glycosyltransferase involved in cell wall biosynthesis
MTTSLFLNGRFLHQRITGVQRFALETTAAIDRLIDAGEWPETALLIPRKKSQGNTPRFKRLQLHSVGNTQGQVWEQFELPRAARSGTLINLGNTGPVLSGARQVVVIHDAGVFDTPESYSLQFRLWYRTLQKRLISGGANAVTVSRFACRRISQHLGLDPARIEVMYEGADHILRVPADPATLERYRLVAGRYALVVGAGAAHKNLDAMSEAVCFLERQGIVTAVVGAVGASPVFRTNANGVQLGRGLGRVNDAELRALYESALCLLFPSRYEGFGLPPVEALACGCPVIASRGGAVEEVCGDAALYFDSQDPCSLLHAVEQVLDDADLSDLMRKRGLARAASFNWEASARILSNVVRRLQ